MSARVYRLRFRCNSCEFVHETSDTLVKLAPIIEDLANEGIALFELQDNTTLIMNELDNATKGAMFTFTEFKGGKHG